MVFCRGDIRLNKFRRIEFSEAVLRVPRLFNGGQIVCFEFVFEFRGFFDVGFSDGRRACRERRLQFKPQLAFFVGGFSDRRGAVSQGFVNGGDFREKVRRRAVVETAELVGFDNGGGDFALHVAERQGKLSVNVGISLGFAVFGDAQQARHGVETLCARQKTARAAVGELALRRAVRRQSSGVARKQKFHDGGHVKGGAKNLVASGGYVVRAQNGVEVGGKKSFYFQRADFHLSLLS